MKVKPSVKKICSKCRIVPARPGDGHLLRSAAQAAPGIAAWGGSRLLGGWTPTFAVAHAVVLARGATPGPPMRVRRTTVTAISTVRRVLRSAVRERLPPVVREEAWSVAKTALPVEEMAGNRPASNAATKTSAHAKASTTPSTWMPCAVGKVFPRVGQPFGCGEGQQDSGCATRETNQQAFSELLADEGESLRAKGAANGNFFLPRGAARHQQVGHVEAADEEHAARRRT